MRKLKTLLRPVAVAGFVQAKAQALSVVAHLDIARGAAQAGGTLLQALRQRQPGWRRRRSCL